MAIVQVMVRDVKGDRVMFDEMVTITDDLNTGGPDEYAVYSALARAILVHAINQTEKGRTERA